MPKPVLPAFLDAAALQVFADSWPERHVFTHGARERLPALFNHEALSSIDTLTRAYRGDFMECDARVDGKMKPVCDETADAVIARGVTVYLGDIAPLLPTMGEFLEQLAGELGIEKDTIRVGAFVSPEGNGASHHYDVLDVISVQLVGNKRFYVAPVEEIRFPYGYQYNPDMPPFDDLYPQISSRFPTYNEKDFEQIDMRPGSVLCMPRGTWHYTRADSDSLAVSIVLSPPTELDRLQSQLSATLLQSEAWRRPCYGIRKEHGSDYDTLPAVIERLVQRESDPNAGSRCFGPQSRYVRDPSIGLEVQASAGHFTLTLNGRSPDGQPMTARMEVPQQTADVFNWLLKHNGPFSVQQAMDTFPSLPLDYFRQIFQVASETGLARYLWFDPLET